MKLSPRSSTVRNAQHALRLGTDLPWVCFNCGEDDPGCLERHHYLGRKRDKGRDVIVCRNCHRKEEEKLAERGLRGKREPDPHSLALARLEALEILLSDVPKVLAECREKLQGKRHDT